MNCVIKTAALVFSGALCLVFQIAANSAPAGNTFSVPDLGIRYSPPMGMQDRTSSANKEARSHAAAYTGNALNLLLSMSSLEPDNAPEWHQMMIVTYPRAHWSNLADTEAEKKLSTLLAGGRATPASKPQSTTLAGHKFLVSDFEEKEPPLLKHAKIFTTICQTQLVSFVLVSNSAAQVGVMEESLKTLNFSSY
jgi:hypothetical protein